MQTVKPNFFIVGAPKSGTTALYHFLRQHPEIYMPEAKEPHFFGSADEPEVASRSLEEYLDLFRCGAGKPRVGEASVYYLYSKRAARRIHEFDPGARIIIMLRNPVEMIPSLHHQRVYSDNERLTDLDEALAAEAPRKRGEIKIPRKTHNPHALFYRDVGRYSVQVQRYLDVFPREQVHIILFDDFVADLPGVYRRTLEFLGVDPAFRPKFERVNDSQSIRSHSVRRWLERPLDKGRLRGLVPFRRRLYESVRRWNTVAGLKPQVTERQRSFLRREFAEDIRILSSMIGRDLSPWLSAEPDERPRRSAV